MRFQFAVSKSISSAIVAIMLGFAVAPAAAAQERARGFDVPNDGEEGVGTWRAVLVGVSDYTEMGSLQFADNDAEALHRYLVDPNGAAIPEENVKLLLGAEATRPAIGQALIEFASLTQPDDRLLFYFAGHGDVQMIDEESASDAYLLLPGATPGVYSFSNDALDPRKLQKEAALRIKANGGGEFFIILDACRSGQVADTEEGARKALDRLSQWQGVNKLLSSTGEELSWESAEFGGGHGVFTYYLLEAMYGLGDTGPADGKLTFRELERYVVDHVEEATQGRQQPVPFASRPGTMLFEVTEPMKAKGLAMSQASVSTLAVAARGDAPGFDAAPFTADTSVARLLAEFQGALDEGRLLEDADASPNAWDLHQRITAELDPSVQRDADLLRRVRGTLAVALQEFADVPARRFVRGVSDVPASSEFRAAARALARARELLGEDYPLLDEIAAREQFMAAYAIVRERDFSRFDEAEALLQDALAAEPGAAPLHAALATLHQARRDYEPAHVHADRALALAPRWEYAHKVKADLLKDEHRYGAALEAYERLLELHPNSSYAHNNRGVLFDDIDRFAAARADFERALELSDNAFYLTNLASVAIDQERLGEADSLLTEAARKAPNSRVVHYQFGRLMRARKLGGRAEEYFRRAIELDRFNASTHIYLGNLFYGTDRARAEASYREAIRLDPGNAWAHAQLGWLLAARDSFAAGERILLEADGASALPEPAYYIGRFYAGHDRPEQAEQYLRAALERNRLYYRAYLELADLLAAQQRHTEAGELFSRAVSLFEGNPVPSLREGAYQFTRGDVPGAASSYERALRVDPLNVTARAALAEIRAEQGRLDEAAGLYREVAVQDPERYVAGEIASRFEARAEALEERGDLTAAVRAWETARSFMPEGTRADLRIARLQYAAGDPASARPLAEAVLARLDRSEASARAQALTLIALILLDLEQPEDALVRLDEANALRMIPDRKTRALILLAADRQAEAVAMLRSARDQPAPFPYSSNALSLLQELELALQR